MTVVVTGGGGFAMANFARHWLQSDPAARAILVDLAPLDAAATRFLAPFAERLSLVVGDVAAPETWRRLPADVNYVVHGAAVTPHGYVDAQGQRREPERDNPLAVLRANIMGTAQVLDWARSLPQLRRFVYVGTGSVYAEAVPAQESEPFALPEDGYVSPRMLYDVSKYSAELISRRFAELYGLPAVAIRLSTVFGPLDRVTPVRHVRNIAHIIAHAAAAGRTVRAVSAEAVGDYIYAPDAAEALRRILLAPDRALRHKVYNIAYGATATVRDLAGYASEVAPGFALQTAYDAAADIVQPADRRTGRWAAYDIARAAHDLAWRPRPLRQAMRDYIEWLRQNEA
jgi:UDP-glucose 4-epimerase